MKPLGKSRSQAVCRFQRWSSDYLVSLANCTKWNRPHRNFQVGDLVCLRDEEVYSTKWPLAHVTAVHPGTDGLVRVITVKTAKGIYVQTTCH